MAGDRDGPAGPSGYTGRPLRRSEDERYLRGQASFVDDIDLPGTLHAAVLRSPHAHARLLEIDVTAVRTAPDVAAVLTAADLPASALTLPMVRVVPGQKALTRPVLAREKVRHVGEAIVILAAEDRYRAEDALELIGVAFDPLPAVVDAEAALAAGSPLLFEEWGDNLIGQINLQHGDATTDFASAEVVIRRRLRLHRHTGFPLETRGALAALDRRSRVLTLWSSTQVPHHARTVVARALGIPENRLRVVAPDVGGAFGNKDHVYPEEVLVCLLALRTGRPVKWVADRREDMLSTVHAREQVHDVELAARRDGTILGIRDRVLADMGAYLSGVGIGPLSLTAAMLPGPYRHTCFSVEARAVATNKVASGAYRGFGMMQATWVLERMVDELAEELRLDPAEVRRRNLVTAAEMPYVSVTDQRYDSGDYPAALEKVLAAVDYSSWREGQAQGQREERRLGIGLSCCVETTGLGPAELMAARGFQTAGYEQAVARVDPQGGVTVYTGVCAHGQGQETTLAQLCADQLGVSFGQVRVVQGDSDTCPYSGLGSVASRGAAVAGAAVIGAAREVRGKVLRLAAAWLEATADDLELREGRVWVRGAPARGMDLAEIAREAYLGHRLPPGEQPGLESSYVHEPAGIAFAYGAHAAVVEVDTRTGAVRLLRYAVAHDCGTMINPLVVEGQVAGGVAQGIGGALLEELRYDETGQLLSGTFMDYLMPTAADLPAFQVVHLESPSPVVPGGMKGVGEAGTIPSPAAIANAIADALRPGGGRVEQLPLHPERVWGLVRRPPQA